MNIKINKIVKKKMSSQLSLPLLHYYYFTYVCTHFCVNINAHVCMPVWRPEVYVTCLPHFLSYVLPSLISFRKRALLLNSELTE